MSEENNLNNPMAGEILIGPDLNKSKSALDTKEYRQILLPNGLRAILISDKVAMTQSYNNGGIFMYDQDEEVETDEEDEEEESEDDEHDEDSEEGEEESKDGKGGGGDTRGGLRDAAAAMVVGVGSMYDPPHCQGLAHFLEHLLFMGSTKYPEENAYDAFMAKHGGCDNAYTELEYTVYHFEIAQEFLAKALDMFAQFFISPLMLEGSVERELNAIESEFQLAKNSDGSRVQHLMSHTCGYTPAEHPFATFSWGNLESLKEAPKRQNVDPMKELWKFYKEHYYASNMRLVVIGGYSLDVLQEEVVKAFSAVPSNGTKPSWETPPSPLQNLGMPFTNACLGKAFYIVPVKDRHGISITWQLPSQKGNWRSKPEDYIAHLIGHEAEGSILAALKAKGWATGCCAGVGEEGYESTSDTLVGFQDASSHSLFIVSFTLLKEGIAHWKELVSLVYQYIGMLRYHCEQGLPKWIFDELRSINEISYRYVDEESPIDCVEGMADDLAPSNPVPPDRLLDFSSLLFDYEPDKIKILVDTYFNPKNARIDIASTQFGRSADFEHGQPVEAPQSTILPRPGSSPEQEPVFGTFYWTDSIPETQLEEWASLVEPQLPPPESMLSLPPQNTFIPTAFALKPLPPADSDHPLLNCCIKLQIPVGKRKEWFPATVTKYNSVKNEVLVSYEDQTEKWHKVDAPESDLSHHQLVSSEFESTLDNKELKFRVVALATKGSGGVRKFGDESDYETASGAFFPPIPPPAPESRLPKLVCSTQTLKLWHLQDRTFKRPIADLRLQLNCEANKTPLHKACADLLVYLVCDALTETAYMASVCELSSALSSNDGGFYMRVHGFDDKLLDLFLVLFDFFFAFRGLPSTDAFPEGVKEGRFPICLESYRRDCANAGLKAGKLVGNIRVRCLRPNCWSSNQKLKAIENLSEKVFLETISTMLNKIGIEGLYHGNVDKSDAGRLQELIQDRLSKGDHGGGLVRKKYPLQMVTRLPPTKTSLKCLCKDPQESNTAVEVYYQIGKDNTDDRAMADFLSELMYEPFYDQVRTKDQFGYDVSCDSRWTNGIIGMYFKVVTSSKTAQEAEDRVEQFIREYRETLVDMSVEDFNNHLNSLAKQKLEIFDSLSEETGHYWNEIRDGRLMWEVQREEAISLCSITREKTLEAYDRWLMPGSDFCRPFAVQVICEEGASSAGKPTLEAGTTASDLNDACHHIEFNNNNNNNNNTTAVTTLAGRAYSMVAKSSFLAHDQHQNVSAEGIPQAANHETSRTRKSHSSPKKNNARKTGRKLHKSSKSRTRKRNKTRSSDSNKQLSDKKVVPVPSPDANEASTLAAFAVKTAAPLPRTPRRILSKSHNRKRSASEDANTTSSTNDSSSSPPSTKKQRHVDDQILKPRNDDHSLGLTRRRSFVMDVEHPAFVLLEELGVSATSNMPGRSARMMELPTHALLGVWTADFSLSPSDSSSSPEKEGSQHSCHGSDTVRVRLRHPTWAHLERLSASCRQDDDGLLNFSKIRPYISRTAHLRQQFNAWEEDVQSSNIVSISIVGFPGFSSSAELHENAVVCSNDMLGVHASEEDSSNYDAPSCPIVLEGSRGSIGVSVPCSIPLETDYNIWIAQDLSLEGCPIVAMDVELPDESDNTPCSSRTPSPSWDHPLEETSDRTVPFHLTEENLRRHSARFSAIDRGLQEVTRQVTPPDLPPTVIPKPSTKTVSTKTPRPSTRSPNLSSNSSLSPLLPRSLMTKPKKVPRRSSFAGSKVRKHLPHTNAIREELNARARAKRMQSLLAKSPPAESSESKSKKVKPHPTKITERSVESYFPTELDLGVHMHGLPPVEDKYASYSGKDEQATPVNLGCETAALEVEPISVTTARKSKQHLLLRHHPSFRMVLLVAVTLLFQKALPPPPLPNLQGHSSGPFVLPFANITRQELGTKREFLKASMLYHSVVAIQHRESGKVPPTLVTLPKSDLGVVSPWYCFSGI
eukprot:Nitzschia sp. Nitz4//scaffold226_size53432//33390//40437//NITZ4_006704-RA/size53432-augustus-gene-0.57-mRNA-1//1//CDS//3329542760//8579//frame0